MADVNSFVGKWCPVQAVEATEENAVQAVAQFFKDGSCTIPASMLGKDDLDFIFYQVFENGMMKLNSATMTPALFRCELTGDTMTLSAVDGSASFSFVKVKEEKRSLFKSKSSDAAPAKAKEVEPEPEPEPGEHEWKCPECGKINQNYVGTCGCGAAKPNDKLFSWAEVHPELVVKEEPVEEPIPEPEEKVEEKPAEPEREPDENEWKCPDCGKINLNYVGTCGCGASKPNDKLFNWAEVHPELVKKEEPVEEPVPEPEEVEKKPAEPEREPDENEWKCPDCGKINLNYVGTCGCGAAKPNDKLFNWAEVHPELVKKEEPAEEQPVEQKKEKVEKKPAEPEIEPGENEWKCPDCGKINQNYVGTCGCGAAKPNDKLFNWAEVHPELVGTEKTEEESASIDVSAPSAEADKSEEK